MDLQQATLYWRQRLDDGKPIYRVRIRRLLELAGAERRGETIMQRISEALEDRGLTTEPDFSKVVWIDALVTVKRIGEAEATNTAQSSANHIEQEEIDPAIADFAATADGHEHIAPVAESLNVSLDHPGVVEVQTVSQDHSIETADAVDPIRRVGGIPSANRGVVSVNLQDPLETATTRMALDGYSQLAIMQNDRNVRGMISWESVARRTLRSPTPTAVSDCKIDAQVIEADASLFDALPTIEKHGYVLVRAQGKITGIVTASDVAMELREISYAFTSIGTIEGLIRKKLHPKLTERDVELLEEHSKARQEANLSLTTFGENVRLLERDVVWQRLGLRIDKAQFTIRLHRIREIRNDVMHFNPDPLGANQKREIEQMEAFLRDLFA